MLGQDLINSLFEGKTVKVRFNQNSTNLYTYKCHIEDIAVGDLVVVKTPQDAYKIVSVEEIGDEFDLEENIQYKWIVDKIDFSKYFEIQAKEEELLKKIKNIKRKTAQKQLLENLGLALEDLKLLEK